MTDPNEFLRKVSIQPSFPSEDFRYLDDPYLQQFDGNSFKCTLCSAVLPGPSHVSMHLQGKWHMKKVSGLMTHPDDPGYLEQYGRQFFDGELELTFGIVGKAQAPAHFDSVMRCELCEAELYGWDQWLTHFISKKHNKARRNIAERLFWQCLHADFPYYYEHVSGMWQTTPPKRGHAVKGGKIVVLPQHQIQQV